MRQQQAVLARIWSAPVFRGNCAKKAGVQLMIICNRGIVLSCLATTVTPGQAMQEQSMEVSLDLIAAQLAMHVAGSVHGPA